MKLNKIIWVTTFLFVTIVSCKKNDPDLNESDLACKEASCCNPEFNVFVEYVSDAQMSLFGLYLISTKEYPSNNNISSKRTYLRICEKSLDKIKDYDPYGPAQRIKPYKVSGKILSDVRNPRNVVTPVLSIFIDKIELISN